jgi:hypothetical protein
LACGERSERLVGAVPVDHGTDDRAQLPTGHELRERGQIGADVGLISRCIGEVGKDPRALVADEVE